MRSYLNALIGNVNARERIGSSIERGTLPHALLIEGPGGSGKHTLATEIAAALNCEHRADPSYPLPCHSCNSCRRISARSFTDVKVLSKAKDKATIGVGEVKLFKEDMYLSATESDYKIYIIENAELLTPQAQNALLIALEEPPRNVVIMLLCEQADKLLSTIKSRVQQVAMSRFRIEELDSYISANVGAAADMKQLDSKKFKGILLASDGYIGRAIELISPKNAEESRRKRALTENIVSKMTARTPYSQLMSVMRELSAKRADLSDELEQIMLALRDLISKKIRADAPPLFFTSEADLCSRAAEFELKRLFYLFDLICDAYGENKKNANVAMLITNLTAKIKDYR